LTVLIQDCWRRRVPELDVRAAGGSLGKGQDVAIQPMAPSVPPNTAVGVLGLPDADTSDIFVFTFRRPGQVVFQAFEVLRRHESNMARYLIGILMVVFSFCALQGEGKADCLACKCGSASEILPVTSTAECTTSCAAYGISCNGDVDAQQHNRKLHIIPQSGRAFDITCTIGVVSGGDPHPGGKLPESDCADPNFVRPNFCNMHPGMCQ